MKKINKFSKKAVEEMLQIYNNSFDLIKTNLETFSNRLMLNNANTYALVELLNDKIIGYSIINKNTILLLCVDENYRNKGIGSILLSNSEKSIKDKKYQLVNIGSGDCYLIPGVPEDTKSNYFDWFEKRGYAKTWISFDMLVDLTENEYELSNKFTIRPATNDDLPAILALAEQFEGWKAIYEKEDIQNIALAFMKKELVGIIIIENDACLYPESIKNCGNFGCLGVKEQYRKHGIGTALLKYALNKLKAKNNFCHIGYTYLDWWYARVGAKKYINYAMCDKYFINK